MSQANQLDALASYSISMTARHSSWIPVLSFIPQIFSEQQSLFTDQGFKFLFFACHYSWNLNFCPEGGIKSFSELSGRSFAKVPPLSPDVARVVGATNH